MQAGRLEVPVVATLEGFARELRSKVEAVAEGVAAKIAVKVDGKGLRKQLKRVVEEASKGVTAKVRVEVEEDRQRLRREVSAVTDEAAQGAAVNVPVRLADDDGPAGTRSRSSGPSGLSRLATRLRGSLRGLLTRVARDPSASTVRVRVAPSRDSSRSFSRSLSGIAAVALRQLRVLSRNALAPTQGTLRTFVREMGRIAVTAGRDTAQAFSRAFSTLLGRQGTGLRDLMARIRVGVSMTGASVRGFVGDARSFISAHTRDLVARARVTVDSARGIDLRAIGREMRRLGEEAADALRLAFGGRLGGMGWLDGLVTGPLRDLAVRVRVGLDVSRQSAAAFARSVTQMASRYRTQFTVGVRMAAASSRTAAADFGRSITRAISPYSSYVAARVRVLAEPARSAVTGLARDLRRITATATRDTRNAVRVAVRPATRAVADLTRGVATIVGRASRAATSVVRARVAPGSARSGVFQRGLRGILRAGQAFLNSEPLSVPVNPQLGGRSGRRRFRLALIGSIVSLLQPAAAALSQYAQGLYAMVSAAAPAVGVLGAIPGLVAAGGTALIAGKVAFSGFTKAVLEASKAQQQLADGGKLTKAQQEALKQAMDRLSPSAQRVAKQVVGLSGAWSKVQMSVSERLFSKIDKDIKPLAKSTFPLLDKVLGGAAGQLGDLAHRGAEFMQTGVFRSDFKRVGATSNSVIGNITDGLANLGHATLDFLVASGPFVEQVGQGAERLTAWMRSSIEAGRETGSLARFLDHAREKADQLGRSTREMFKGFSGAGKAGQEVGDSLLDGLEGTMTRFDRWANSKPGQKVMRQFFSDSADTFHELNALVGDFVRGLGRAAKDGGVTDLIRQIRVQLMPALGTFFTAIGHNIGPALISLISNLATAFGDLSSAGSGLGLLMVAFSGLVNDFNALMRFVPGANTVLATFLGTMLALKVVSSVTGMLTRMRLAMAGTVTSLRTVGSTMNGSLGPSAIGPQITGWQRVSTAYRTAASQGGRLSGALSGIRAANRGAVSALGGLTGALGGPLGIAITAATIGLGLLANKQEENARAAQAHKERVSSLAEALAQSNGLIDANVRAQAVQILQDTDLASGKGRLVDVMRDAGVNLKTLTNAYLEQDGSVDDLKSHLMDLANAHQYYREVAGGKADVLDYDEQGQRYKDAADALGSVNGELKKGKRDAKEQADALREAGTIGTDSYTRLSSAVDGFNDKTKTSDERVQALKAALDDLKGNTMSLHDAETKLNQAMLTIDDTVKNTIKRSDGWGKSLIGTDKLVNTSTKNGQTLNSQLEDLRDGLLQVATSSREAYDNGQLPLSKAMDLTRSAAEKARQKAIDYAIALGVPEKAAQALADQMGLVPNDLSILVTTEGMPKATSEVLSLAQKLAALPAGKGIQITSPTIEARTQLEALGYTFTRIPGSKKIVVTAPTKAPRADISALIADIAAAPDKKKVTVQTVVKQAATDLRNVQGKVAGLKGKSLVISAPTKTAQAALKDLGYKIKTVDGTDGKKVRITVPDGTALAQIRSIQSKINGLTGKTVRVTVQYSESGKPSVVRANANGSITRFSAYAEGGIRRAVNRVQAFANGAENHVAQIGKPGDIRLWNEAEAGGEAYVPLSPSKRTRSKAILDQVAKIFGGMVVYPEKGMQAFADGAVRLARSASLRPSVARTASTPQGAGALVGGDLNLTVGAVDSTGTALQDAMFELRRMRLGGSFE